MSKAYVAIRNYPAAIRSAHFLDMTSEERRQKRYERRQAKRAEAKRSRQVIHDDFETVFSYRNLYNSYRKCREGVTWKASVQKFIVQAPLEVDRIHNRLMDGRWKSKGFYEFDIVERGKPRHIQSVTIDERIVQRCLCDQALVPMIAPGLIYDNGACIKDKGYHFAIRRCEKHLHDHFRKYGVEGYVLQFDFSKFFDNVSHAACKNIVERNFDDQRIRKLVFEFIDAFGPIGLGLGSQISQIFALASANRLNHVIKEDLRIHGYGRYMDDGYLIHPDKEYLRHCMDVICQICIQLGIPLNESKTRITKLSRGFTFLKCRFYLTKSGRVVKKIPRTSIVKMRRKLKKFRVMVDQGKLTEKDVEQAFQSWRSYARHFNAFHTIQSMEKLYADLFLNGRKKICTT